MLFVQVVRSDKWSPRVLGSAEHDTKRSHGRPGAGLSKDVRSPAKAWTFGVLAGLGRCVSARRDWAGWLLMAVVERPFLRLRDKWFPAL